jgi:hypothetical protein
MTDDDWSQLAYEGEPVSEDWQDGRQCTLNHSELDEIDDLCNMYCNEKFKFEYAQIGGICQRSFEKLFAGSVEPTELYGEEDKKFKYDGKFLGIRYDHKGMRLIRDLHRIFIGTDKSIEYQMRLGIEMYALGYIDHDHVYTFVGFLDIREAKKLDIKIAKGKKLRCFDLTLDESVYSSNGIKLTEWN